MSITSTAHLARVYDLLIDTYGQPINHPDYDPVGGLVGTILSQHTSDVNSDRAYHQLVATFPTWEAVRDAPVDAMIASLSTIGIDHLLDMRPEEAWHWLRRLSGVGPKTAACVLMFNLDMPVMPVDTHVHRVSQRLGLIGPKVNADQAHEILDKVTPPAWVYPLHVNLIRHGRQICHAQRPACNACPLYSECAFVGSVNAQDTAIPGQ